MLMVSGAVPRQTRAMDAMLAQPVAVVAVFFLAGAVKGVVGMGLPTVAMGFLGLLMPVGQAAALLTVPSLVTNVWQAVAGPHLRAVLQRLWTMQAGIVGGTLLTAWVLPMGNEAAGRQMLGACLVLYSGCGLRGLRLPAGRGHREALWGALAGGVTGAITAVTGVFVLPAVPYLQSLSLAKEEMSQALGVSFTTSTLALGLALAWQGSLTLSSSAYSLLALAPALGGMLLGQKVRRRLSEAGFRKVLFWGLLLLGVWLLVG
jgi:uncharacterized membrane protein YfcA